MVRPLMFIIVSSISMSVRNIKRNLTMIYDFLLDFGTVWYFLLDFGTVWYFLFFILLQGTFFLKYWGNNTITERDIIITERSVWPSWSWSYGGWIYNYLCNQYLSPLTLWVRTILRRGVAKQPYMIKFRGGSRISS
jgi:hypothetical protein